MGAKASSLDPHPNQPYNHAISPLSVFHLHPNPQLSRLGISSYPLYQAPLNFPFSSPKAPKVGFLSFLQKGQKIWAPWDLMEVQVPIPTASTVDSCKGSWGSSVGRRKGKSTSGRGWVGNDLEVMFTIWFLFWFQIFCCFLFCFGTNFLIEIPKKFIPIL
jgi:hypothetical protein